VDPAQDPQGRPAARVDLQDGPDPLDDALGMQGRGGRGRAVGVEDHLARGAPLLVQSRQIAEHVRPLLGILRDLGPAPQELEDRRQLAQLPEDALEMGEGGGQAQPHLQQPDGPFADRLPQEGVALQRLPVVRRRLVRPLQLLLEEPGDAQGDLAAPRPGLLVTAAGLEQVEQVA